MSELSEAEKQRVSVLAMLTAGLAGSLIGGSSADAIVGVQIGKKIVENNLLGGSEDA